MPTVIEAPVEFMETVSHLRLPPHEDQHLQELMDANTNGTLTPEERTQLESLVEWSEALSLLRAQALQLLRKQAS